MTLRDLPSVEKLASDALLAHLPDEAAVIAARQAIAEAREQLRASEETHNNLAERALVLSSPRVTTRRAINATGVLLHTNLGRATLAPSAAAAIASVAGGHATLEVDAESGGRGDRQKALAALLCELTGAEDALVVNNNAAATFLAVAAIARNREVILSRGQMVEIGGHFRLPEVIEEAGAQLKEVGTTNRTRISDYAKAIGENSGMLLRCHPSNYRIVGFSEEASLEELVALSKQTGVVFGDDIGSGALVDFSPFGLTDEPQVQKSVAAGADLVWFSGDKLIGGPQSGILIGRRELITRLKKHPLARALRPDKLTVAGLEATLLLYKTGRAWTEVPILRRISRTAESVKHACERVQSAISLGEVIPTLSEIGGGSLPDRSLPSFALAISGDVSALAQRLRQLPTPIYGRIEKQKLLLDLRAVDANEEAELIAAIK
jgi:L-seryl-tRNA(Ser) seleniumtransferase